MALRSAAAGLSDAGLGRLVAAWKAALDAVAHVGGHITLQSARSAAIRHSELWGLTIERPALPEDIKRIERNLGLRLPSALSEFFLKGTRSVHFRWQLPSSDLLPLPDRFRGLFGGGFSLSLDALPDHEDIRRGVAEDCFNNADDPYDAVWQQKLGVLPVPNGDYLGIDLRAGDEGEVVYLSHDDGAGHGHVLGADFTDFLRRWTPLGCPRSRGLAVAALYVRRDDHAGPGRRGRAGVAAAPGLGDRARLMVRRRP